MTLTATSQHECLENCPTGFMVLRQPGIATFTCTYELSVGTYTTDYSWYRDGFQLAGQTTSVASIDIGSGDHTVECRANIVVDVGCECDATMDIDITVLGMHYA